MSGHIALEELLAYWFGELSPQAEAPIEAHVMGCDACTERLEELAALASGVRAAFRAGRVAAVISAPFLEVLRRHGLRLREYRVPPGGRVNCTLLAEDDGVVSRLQAPLAGVQRVDLLQRLELDGGVREERVADVPFDPAAGEVLNFPSAAQLRTMPAHTVRMRLVAVEEGSERTLGEYTFAHTPGDPKA